MTFEERISALNELGQFFVFLTHKNGYNQKFKAKFEYIEPDALAFIHTSKIQNPWFTEEQIDYTLAQWGKLLNADSLRDWLSKYEIRENHKSIGLVLAGNIPLVGLHDLISVILTGNNAKIKASSKDNALIDLVLYYLGTINEEFKKIIIKVERLTDVEAVIATGSNNTARYFEYYFKDIPNIIRKNRTSAAIITGDESEEELKSLGEDIFRYYGLGCRNVTHLFVPENYNFNAFFEAVYHWSDVINHHKYANNYTYNRTIYLMEKADFLDNNFLLVKRDDDLFSPIGVLNYSYYKNPAALAEVILHNEKSLQCIVGKPQADIKKVIPFGQSQKPKLNDYADNMDTIAFLSGI